MYLDYLVPSWHEIESRVIAMVGYQSGGQFRTSLNEEVASLGLNLRRIEAVRTAFYHAEWQAAHTLRQRFADLDINSIVDELLMVVRQMAMIVAGSTMPSPMKPATITLAGSRYSSEGVASWSRRPRSITAMRSASAMASA